MLGGDRCRSLLSYTPRSANMLVLVDLGADFLQEFGIINEKRPQRLIPWPIEEHNFSCNYANTMIYYVYYTTLHYTTLYYTILYYIMQ